MVVRSRSRGRRAGQTCHVLLADNQPVYLDALAKVVGGIQKLRVVTHNLQDGLESPKGPEPDVIVIDPSVGGVFSTDHLEATKRLWPLSRVMVLTDCNEQQAIASALAFGATSYILKSESLETIRTAIELLCAGGAAFSYPVAAVMAARVTPPVVTPSLPAAIAKGLSPREVEIVQLVARGLTDAEIGKSISISPRTVQRHITNILNKLNCRNRSHAVALVVGTPPPLSIVR